MKTYDGPSCDQIIVRLWKWCNFKCNFCNVSDNERYLKNKENNKEIIYKLLYKIKHSPAKKWELINFTISWWEPTLFKEEFLFIVKYIKILCNKKGIIPNFDFQTNSTCLDKEFYEKIFNYWVKKVLVSFHTIKKENFKKLIWVDYSNLNRVIQWINLMNEVWLEIWLNIVINKINYKEFFDLINYCIKKFPFISNYYIGFVQPHWEAYKNFDQLFLLYKDIEYYYNKWIYLLLRNNKKITSHFVWLPACYIINKKTSLEVIENINFRKKYSFNKLYFINKVNDLNKIYKDNCKKCLYNNICSWIWYEYYKKQEVKPISYQKYFLKNNNNFNQSIIYDKNNNLKKIFDKNIKHLILLDNLSLKDILYITRLAIKIWFYKVSLVLRNTSNFNDKLLFSWITNYQLNIKNISNSFIDKIYLFNDNYWLQFRIYLDILIEKDFSDKLKIDYIINKEYKNIFINFYIVKNSKILLDLDERKINYTLINNNDIRY